MIKKELFFLILFFTMPIYSQGNGLYDSSTGIDTIPDTTYFQSESFASKEKIYTITLFNSNRTKREYRVFYTNGQLSYFCQYEYDNDGCSRIRYYNAANEITSYGVYSTNTIGGKDFKFYDKNNILLWIEQYSSKLSALDSTPRCEDVINYTINNQIYSFKNLDYTADGWLNKEIYLDYKKDTTAVVVWEFDPVANNTLYTFTKKNKTLIFNSLTQYKYDKYTYYYHSTNNYPDSVKTFLRDTLLYTVKFEYDSKGWLLREKLFDKLNTAINRGEYSYDKSTSITSYKYYRAPSELLFISYTDCSGLQTESEYYSNNQLSYCFKYSYNSDFLQDTIFKVSPSGTLMSYEIYTYYTPYTTMKRYTLLDSKNNILSYINYNEYGFITDSMSSQSVFHGWIGGKKTFYTFAFKGDKILLDADKKSDVELSLVTLDGKNVGHIRQSLCPGKSVLEFSSNGKIGSGNYIVKGFLGDIPVNKYIKNNQIKQVH